MEEEWVLKVEEEEEHFVRTSHTHGHFCSDEVSVLFWASAVFVDTPFEVRVYHFEICCLGVGRELSVHHERPKIQQTFDGCCSCSL